MVTSYQIVFYCYLARLRLRKKTIWWDWSYRIAEHHGVVFFDRDTWSRLHKKQWYNWTHHILLCKIILLFFPTGMRYASLQDCARDAHVLGSLEERVEITSVTWSWVTWQFDFWVHIADVLTSSLEPGWKLRPVTLREHSRFIVFYRTAVFFFCRRY